MAIWQTPSGSSRGIVRTVRRTWFRRGVVGVPTPVSGPESGRKVCTGGPGPVSCSPTREGTVREVSGCGRRRDVLLVKKLEPRLKPEDQG